MDLRLDYKFRYAVISTVIRVGLIECLRNVVRIGTRRGKVLLDNKPGGGIKKDDLE